MFGKYIKLFIVASALTIAMSFSSLAADRSFPFDVEFDNDEVERLCYAGHHSSTVNYADGLAVMPETYFSIVENEGSDSGAYDLSKLSADISLIYENDTQSGYYKETIRTYEKGALNLEDCFPILSENIIANLTERDKLYSGNLNGFMMTLKYDGRTVKKKTIYLYMCGEDDYYDFLDELEEE